MTPDQLTALFQQFTAPTDLREWLHAPFTHTGQTYACNGIAAIIYNGELPNTEPASELQAAMTPKVVKLLGDLDPEDYYPLNRRYPEPKRITCAVCEGTGHTQECENCDGEGEFSRDGHECQSCDGTGSVGGDTTDPVCLHCAGQGWFHEAYEKTPIHGGYIDLRWLYLLQDLPGFQLANRPINNNFSFVFDGGRGVVASMRA